MTEWLIRQDKITTLNVYVTPNRASKCRKQKLVKLSGERDKSTIIIRDFNTSLSVIGKTRQKINKDIELSIINQLDWIDIYRILHLTTMKCTFFSSARRKFTKVGLILGSSLNKFTKIQIIQSMLSNYNKIKLEIKNK